MIKMQFQSINLYRFCQWLSVRLGAFCVPEVFVFFSSSVFMREPNYNKPCLPRLPVEIVFGLPAGSVVSNIEHAHILVDTAIDVSSELPLLTILGSIIASVKSLLEED